MRFANDMPSFRSNAAPDNDLSFSGMRRSPRRRRLAPAGVGVGTHPRVTGLSDFAEEDDPDVTVPGGGVGGLGTIGGATVTPSDTDIDQMFDQFGRPVPMPGLTSQAFRAGVERFRTRTGERGLQQEASGQRIDSSDTGPGAAPEGALTDTPEGMATAQGINNALDLGLLGNLAVSQGGKMALNAAIGPNPFGPLFGLTKFAMKQAVNQEAANQAGQNPGPNANPMADMFDQQVTAQQGAIAPEDVTLDVANQLGMTLGTPNSPNSLTTNFGGARGAADDDPTSGPAPTATGPGAVDPNDPGMNTPTDPGGGGAGGSAACFLASWTLDRLPKEQAATGRQFFTDFYQMFMASDPTKAKKLMAVYQAIAKKILAKVAAADPQTQAQVQAYLFKTLVQPTGDFLERKELEGAVKNLVTVVTTLAKKFGVPMPTKQRTAGVTPPASFGLGAVAGAQGA